MENVMGKTKYKVCWNPVTVSVNPYVTNTLASLGVQYPGSDDHKYLE